MPSQPSFMRSARPRPLVALDRLGPGEDDPSIQNFLYNNALKDETEDRKIMSLMAGDRDTRGLDALIGKATSGIEESPITAQGEDLDVFNKANQASQLAGFGSPQEQALYKRGREEFAQETPREVANIGAEGGLAQQKQQGRDALAVEQARRGSVEGIQKSFLDMLGGVDNIDSVTMPGQYGGGGFNRQNPQPGPSASLQNALTNASANLASANNDNTRQRERRIASAQAEWSSAATNLLSSERPTSPSEQESLNYVLSIVQDPTSHGKTLEQILAEDSQDTLKPDEIAVIKRYMQRIGRQ